MKFQEVFLALFLLCCKTSDPLHLPYVEDEQWGSAQKSEHSSAQSVLYTSILG